MAEKKISTIILKVDLECTRCYKKISKAICKIQEKENIQSIVFDEKTNTVTISGPFDPRRVIKKLCCSACKVIKDIQIKDNKEKEKPKDVKPAAEPAKDTKPAADKPKDDKPKDTKPAADKLKDDKPKDAKPADEPKKDKAKDAKPAAEPAKEKPKDAEPQKDKPKALESYPPASEPGIFMVREPRFDYQPVWGGPVCGCGGRQYEGYYGDNRGCWCGRGSGWAPGGPTAPLGQPLVVYGQPVYGGGYKTQNYFCEEDPQSCNIM